jgi:hypothetical protein
MGRSNYWVYYEERLKRVVFMPGGLIIKGKKVYAFTFKNSSDLNVYISDCYAFAKTKNEAISKREIMEKSLIMQEQDYYEICNI